jgi:hypothetical protein
VFIAGYISPVKPKESIVFMLPNRETPGFSNLFRVPGTAPDQKAEFRVQARSSGEHVSPKGRALVQANELGRATIPTFAGCWIELLSKKLPKDASLNGEVDGQHFTVQLGNRNKTAKITLAEQVWNWRFRDSGHTMSRSDGSIVAKMGFHLRLSKQSSRTEALLVALTYSAMYPGTFRLVSHPGGEAARRVSAPRRALHLVGDVFEVLDAASTIFTVVAGIGALIALLFKL